MTESNQERNRIRHNEKQRQMYARMSPGQKYYRNEQRRIARGQRTSIKQSDLYGFSRLSKIGTQSWCLPETSSCKYCNAFRFYREPSGFCCSSGQVSLSLLDVPDELRSLIFGCSQLSLHFRANIRTYNNAFAFTSFGVTYDKDLCRNDKNVYTFKVQGMVYHFINDLIPVEGKGKNLQLYFYDTENEVCNRLAVSDKLNEEVISMILKLLDVNRYSSFFRNLREYSNLDEYKIVLRADPGLNQNTHNLPTVDQIAAIWKDSDEPNQSQPRDIQVFTNSDHSQRVEYYYGCNDPLQYVILFPRGEPGWHVGIKRKRSPALSNPTEMLTSCEGEHSTHPSYASSGAQLLHAEAKVVENSSKKRDTISAREYYCYRLQMRNNDRSILLHSGRLLQQYLNDMYVKVETQRLDFFRNEQRQKNARIESLQGIVDSLGIDGENDASKIGQRL